MDFIIPSMIWMTESLHIRLIILCILLGREGFMIQKEDLEGLCYVGQCLMMNVFLIEKEPAYECPGQPQPPASILSEHRYPHC